MYFLLLFSALALQQVFGGKFTEIKAYLLITPKIRLTNALPFFLTCFKRRHHEL